MEIIYDIEDAIDKTKALAAVKREIKLYIEENKDRKVELFKLFLAAYQRVADKIWDSYKQGYNNHKKYDNMDIEYFHKLFLQHLKEEKYDSINANKDRKKALYGDLLYYLKCNVPVLETTFEKKGKNCTKVQEWIKPYYKNIFIWATTIILNNIEGYDFTGFGDVYINIDTIDKTLKNTKLRGVLFSDNYKRNYVLIDPSIINIEGADFTGSKGAYIILDNIDKLPPRCNLTDTII